MKIKTHAVSNITWRKPTCESCESSESNSCDPSVSGKKKKIKFISNIKNAVILYYWWSPLYCSRLSSRQTADGSEQLVGIGLIKVLDQSAINITNMSDCSVCVLGGKQMELVNAPRVSTAMTPSSAFEPFFFFCLMLFILINAERRPALRAAANKNGHVPNVAMCQEGEDKTARQNVWDAVYQRDSDFDANHLWCISHSSRKEPYLFIYFVFLVVVLHWRRFFFLFFFFPLSY